MFGNFNLNAGLSQLQDLGGRFQKIKEDLEQNIESSLRTNVAPTAGSSLDQDASSVTASADGSVAFGGTVARLCRQTLLLHTVISSQRVIARRNVSLQSKSWICADSWEGYSLGTAPAKAPSSEVMC